MVRTLEVFNMKIGPIIVLFCLLMALTAITVMAKNETVKQNATQAMNISMKNATMPMNQTGNVTAMKNVTYKKNMTTPMNMTKSSDKVKVAATSGVSNPKPAVKSIVVIEAKNTTNNK